MCLHISSKILKTRPHAQRNPLALDATRSIRRRPNLTYSQLPLRYQRSPCELFHQQRKSNTTPPSNPPRKEMSLESTQLPSQPHNTLYLMPHVTRPLYKQCPHRLFFPLINRVLDFGTFGVPTLFLAFFRRVFSSSYDVSSRLA